MLPQDEENRPASSPLPGLWQSTIIAALTALIAITWALPRPATSNQPTQPLTMSELSPVAAEDIPQAIETIDAPRDQLAKLLDPKRCSHIAWVSIAGLPGQPSGQIRLQSGTYVSPAFSLTPTPTRVALPYPGPYRAGHGALLVLGTSADAIIALTPPWHVAANAKWTPREVSWSPDPSCPAGPN